MKPNSLFPGTVLAFAGLCILLPLGWVALSAFYRGNALYATGFSPSDLTLEHFVRLFTTTDFPLWFANTFQIALLNTLAALGLTALTAFSLSRFSFKGKKTALGIVLGLQIFPSFLAMLAVFILLDRWGLLNSFAGLILVYTAGQLPFNTWLVKGFMDGIPRSFDDSARLEGATDLQVLGRIVLPLSLPVLAVVALTNFTAPWFDFVFQSLLLHGKNKTLAVGILEWLHNPSGQEFPLFAAACLLIALPVILVYILLQRFLNAGIISRGYKN